MLNRIASAVLGLALVAPASAFASDWSFDPAHTAAHFSVRHMTVAKVRGEFSGVSGTIKLDDKDVTKSVVEATIPVSTINTREGKRDEHLKSPDFFDAAKFPNITFKSKSVAKAGEGKLKVTGDLTLHGVTKEVVLEVTAPGAEAKDPWGNIKTGFEASTTINRKDFGVGAGTPAMIAGEEVTITLDVEAAKKVAK